MKSEKPSAVLIHGLHLQAPEWEKLAWGTKNLEEAGRIPRGMEVAIKTDASVIIWGTGASVDPETGKKEAQFTHDFAQNHIEELVQYTQASRETLERLLGEQSHIQTETQSTPQEVVEALALCKEKGVTSLYLVSSPTHIARCLLTACQKVENPTDIVLYGVPSDTSAEYWHPRDVVVIEPAHRADRSDAPMNLLAKRMTRARKYEDRAEQLYKDLERVLDEFDEETERVSE